MTGKDNSILYNVKRKNLKVKQNPSRKNFKRIITISFVLKTDLVTQII